MLRGPTLLIGDVHQEDELLAKALAFADQLAIGDILCTGDVCDGQGDLVECCRLLEQANVTTVRGNHDRWALSGRMRDLGHVADPAAVETCRTFLEALPPTLDIETPVGLMQLCHGVDDDDMIFFNEYDDGYALEMNFPLMKLRMQARHRLVVGGHTHHPMVRHLDELTFLNPGTLARDQHPGWAVLHFEPPRFVYYDALGVEAPRSVW